MKYQSVTPYLALMTILFVFVTQMNVGNCQDEVDVEEDEDYPTCFSQNFCVHHENMTGCPESRRCCDGLEFGETDCSERRGGCKAGSEQSGSCTCCDRDCVVDAPCSHMRACKILQSSYTYCPRSLNLGS